MQRKSPSSGLLVNDKEHGMNMQKRIAFFKELRLLMEKYGVGITKFQPDHVIVGDLDIQEISYDEVNETNVSFFYLITPDELDKYISKNDFGANTTLVSEIAETCEKAGGWGVRNDMIDEALSFAQQHNLTLEILSPWLDLPAIPDHPSITTGLVSIAEKYEEDILIYIRRMHNFGGEDTPLMPPLTETVYYYPMEDLSVTDIVAVWFTWVRDVLCMAKDLYSEDIK